MQRSAGHPTIGGGNHRWCAIQHARRNIALRTGMIFALAAVVGAYLGGLTAGWFEGTTLLLLFAGMMLTTSVMMFRVAATSSHGRGACLWPGACRGCCRGFLYRHGGCRRWIHDCSRSGAAGRYAHASGHRYIAHDHDLKVVCRICGL